MEPGIYKKIPFEDYKKWPAVNKSLFHHILKSGLHLKHHLENEEEPTLVQIFGNLVDTMLFEPYLYKERFITPPETYNAMVKKPSKNNPDGVYENKPWDWRANLCKEWKNAQSKTTQIITEDDIYRANIIIDRIQEHPEAGKWLSKTEYQVSLSWIDCETGLPCKGRIDALNEERIIDLKITHDSHPRAFQKTLNNFLYHAGGAFYHDGYFAAQGEQIPEQPEIPFSFIVVEDKEPYDVVCYDLGLESFEVGRLIYKDALSRYKEFKESNEYPGYSNVVEEINIPQYALNKYQYEGVIA